jgi:hypothetical protein
MEMLARRTKTRSPEAVPESVWSQKHNNGIKEVIMKLGISSMIQRKKAKEIIAEKECAVGGSG